MDSILYLFSEIALYFANIGAGAASLWNSHQPDLPAQLRK